MATKKSDAWMPLFVGDYKRDTGHLSTVEHGAYCLLIMHAWTSNGELPVDPERLRIITRMEAKDWKRSKNTLLSFFKIVGGVYRHKRIDAELAKAGRNIEQRSKAGQASAAARKALRDANETSNETSTDVERTLQQDDQRNVKPSPSPSESKKERADTAYPASAGAEAVLPVPVRKNLWDEGVRVIRDATGKPDKPCRALLGRWLRDAKDDCALLLATLREAGDLRPVNFEAWVQAAVKTRMAPDRDGFATLARERVTGRGTPVFPNPVTAFLAGEHVSQ